MREHIDRLLAQTSIVTLALGVAIGWSLFQVANGVADLVQGLLTKFPSGSGLLAYHSSQPATWIVRGRVLTFTTLITGVVELAVVLLVAALMSSIAGCASAREYTLTAGDLRAQSVSRVFSLLPKSCRP